MMMTGWFRAALVATAVSFVGVPSAFAQTPVKIAYINSAKILSEAPGRAEAEATYDREMGAARAQLQQMDDSLKAMVAKFEKEAPALDSVARESRGKVIRDQENEFSKRAQDLNEQMQKRQADLARPLMDQVSKVLEEFRAKGGYSMIFDVGSGNGVVVSADKSLDITDQVLARLKELGPPPAAGAQPAKAPATSPASTTAKPKPAGVTRPHS